MIRIIFPIISVILFLTLFESCKQGSDEWNEKVETELKKRLGKTLTLPNGLKIIKGDTISISKNAPVKLVTFIDGSCGACIENIVFWSEFIRRIQNRNLNCSFHIYIKTNLNPDFEKVLDGLGFHFSWIQDEDMEFVTINDIQDKRFETALLNEDNVAMLFGDPIYRPELAKLYEQVIEEENASDPD